MPYHYLLDAAHRATLDQWAHDTTLFVFDYDGTLAPIVDDPEQAHMAPETQRALTALATQARVAVVSGRACADLKSRLPSQLRYVVGNHGNEGLPKNMGNTEEMTRQCTIWHRQILADKVLWQDAEGALFENKGPSLSLHYRNCVNPAIARSRMLASVARLNPAPRVIRGTCVINLLPYQARTKRDAIESLMQDSGCERVVVIGDDITDELAFQGAPDNWLTVRVGACVHSEARFRLHDIDQVTKLLQYLAHDRGASGGESRGGNDSENGVQARMSAGYV